VKYQSLLSDLVERILRYRFGILPEAPDGMDDIPGATPLPDSASPEPHPIWDTRAFSGLPGYYPPCMDEYPCPLASYGVPDPFNQPFGGEYFDPDPFGGLDDMMGF